MAAPNPIKNHFQPCIQRFVCLSVYMIPCGLLLGSTAAKVLSLWFKCGTKSDVVAAKMFFSDIGGLRHNGLFISEFPI